MTGHDLVQDARRLGGGAVTWSCVRGCGTVTDELVTLSYRCDRHVHSGLARLIADQAAVGILDLETLARLPVVPEPRVPGTPRTLRGLVAGLTPVERLRLATLAAAAGAALVVPLTAVYVAAHLIRWMVIG